MKIVLSSMLVLLAGCSAQTDGPAAPQPAYVDEAPLPEGWPQPGPYDKVTEKKYPASRAAFAQGTGENLTFWTLFAHIKRQDIPMTAPVAKEMGNAEGKLKQEAMAFLYQNSRVGTVGPDGKKVEVREVPAINTLSYTWQGIDSEENIATAKAALDTILEARKTTARSFRMLGYNGPDTPRDKRTWELQAVLE